MQLVTMKCPACAASVNYDNSQSTFKCSYCQNQISIIKPITVTDIVKGLNDTEQNKYSNFLSILDQSMKAGNFLEAYNYCNKALEVNPKSGALWENKAICAFWLSTLENISDDKANEVITYLNASKQNDPDSKTYQETASSISDNLYSISIYKFNNVQPVYINGKNDYTQVNRAQIHLIDIIILCYHIYPRIEYLKYALNLIVKGHWIEKYKDMILNTSKSTSIGFNAKQKYEILLNDIKAIEPNYTPPMMFKRSVNSAMIIMWIVIAFFLLMFILSIISK